MAPIRHGHCTGGATRIYWVWQAMHHRCKHNARYRDRGITVCKRWSGKDGFINFLADMGYPPPSMTLERINNDKGYSKRNCCWATRLQQNNNRRPRTRKIVWCGWTRPELAAHMGITIRTLHWYRTKLGSYDAVVENFNRRIK